ncbi:4-phosphoerythronate dehydrogenase [bacterium]|nr:4-phosphoerythronate dehydrogenase [bacterium]
MADQHIPFISDIFSGLGDLRLIPGQEIDSESIATADALVVRSITRVNEDLLQNSPVSFVGSATAGVDHVDFSYLDRMGIGFGHAPGANAESVVEYVLACLAELSSRGGESFEKRSIGIVGAGNVGRLLATRCSALGMKVLVNDPPLEMKSLGSHAFVDLNTLLRSSDIVSIHTPLTRSGPFPTHRLIGQDELSLVKKGAWFVHAARGGVCDESALTRARQEGHLGGVALDVWENEPVPSLEHIQRADIATGHIAGYSVDAKIRGVHMIREHMVRHFNVDESALQSANNLLNERPGICQSHTLAGRILEMYPIREDDTRFRSCRLQSPDVAQAFHTYRAQYPIRRTFSAFPAVPDTPTSWIEGLNLSLKPEGA